MTLGVLIKMLRRYCKGFYKIGYGLWAIGYRRRIFLLPIASSCLLPVFIIGCGEILLRRYCKGFYKIGYGLWAIGYRRRIFLLPIASSCLLPVFIIGCGETLQL